MHKVKKKSLLRSVGTDAPVTGTEKCLRSKEPLENL